MNQLLLLSLLATGITWQVQPVAGPAVTGELASLDGERLVLKTPGGEIAFPADDLFWAAPEKVPTDKPSAHPVTVELTDGSRLAAQQYTVERGAAKVRLAGETVVDVRTRSVHAVLFKDHQSEAGLAAQWAKILAREDRRGDMIVVRRTVPKTIKTAEGETVQNEYSLDYVDGVLWNVTADAVQFELEGDMNDVPRSRVEGIVYYHAQGDKLAAPLCRITDGAGSLWSAATLAWIPDSGRLSVKTTAGVTVEIPGEELRRLDFSAGKLQYLSDLEPASLEFTPRQSGGASDANYAKLYAFKRDRALLDDGPLLVGKQEYKKGVAVASRTTATFVLPEGYRRLRALAAIDDRAGGRGNVDLVIMGDGRELARHEIDGAGEPVRLDLDVTGVRRLTILADWGKYGDRNDDLDLCEARITK